MIAQAGGWGADIVIDTDGVDMFRHLIAASATNSWIIVLGVLPGERLAVPDYPSLITKNVMIRGIANVSRAMFVDLLGIMVANRIIIIVDYTLAFDDAPKAVSYLANTDHISMVIFLLCCCLVWI